MVVPLFSVKATLTKSENTLFFENRTMGSFPNITIDGLMDGSIITQIDGYYCDHFVGRDMFISLNTMIDLKLNSPVIHDVVIQDDILVPFHGYATWDTGYLATTANDMGDDILEIQTLIQRYGGFFIYLALPSRYTYFEEQYPIYMDNRKWNTPAIHNAFFNALEKRYINYLDMGVVYESLGNPLSYFAQSDHHYTYAGMLVSYIALMETINSRTGLVLDIFTEDDIIMEYLDMPFLGSFNRKLYGLWETAELLEVGYLKNPIPFLRMDN